MTDFPNLETERLKLRKIQIDDVHLLVKYANNKKVSNYILNMPYPYQEPDAVFRISYVHQGFKTNSRYVFAIVLKKDREFIGEISLNLDGQKKVAQLAYWIGEPYWSNGYITEAIEKIVEFGFGKLHLDLMFATCEEENIASMRVLEKNHLTKVNSNGSILQYTISKQLYESLK